MKKIGIYLAALFMTFSFSIFAQQTSNCNKNKKDNCTKGISYSKLSKRNADERADKLAKELNLTEEQKAELIEFFKKNEKERAAYKAKQKAERQKMREQHRTELEKIIGKDNLKKLDQKRADRRATMKEKHKRQREHAKNQLL